METGEVSEITVEAVEAVIEEAILEEVTEATTSMEQEQPVTEEESSLSTSEEELAVNAEVSPEQGYDKIYQNAFNCVFKRPKFSNFFFFVSRICFFSPPVLVPTQKMFFHLYNIGHLPDTCQPLSEKCYTVGPFSEG